MTGSGRRLVVALAMSLVLASSALAKELVPVTGCSQFINDADADVVADIDCSGVDASIVTILNGTVFLNGHTLTGAAAPLGAGGVIHCRGRCRIEGPGTLVGGFAGVTAGTATTPRVRIEHVDIRDSRTVGVNVAASSGRTKLTGVSITGVAGCAFIGTNLRVKESTISGNQCGLWVSGGAAHIIDSQITNNTGDPSLHFGVLAERALALRSTLTGNEPDIKTIRRPAVPHSTCDKSYNLSTGGTWGICALDP